MWVRAPSPPWLPGPGTWRWLLAACSPFGWARLQGLKKKEEEQEEEEGVEAGKEKEEEKKKGKKNLAEWHSHGRTDLTAY